jgi:hypothetical protein
VIYYLVEQRGSRSFREWFVWGRNIETFLCDARAYKKQILREKLADEARIVRVDTDKMTAKVVR